MVTSCSFQYGALGLFAAFGMISLQLIGVSSYPLGFESTGVGIHQRQPSYLPDYNGIFSIHALNFTPAAIDRTEKFLQGLDQENLLGSLTSNGSFDNLVATNESPTTLDETGETNDEPTDRLTPETDGTDTNEVDSESDRNTDGNNQDVAEPATFPQIQVVTKTITEQTFQPSTTTISTTTPSDQDETIENKIATTTELPTVDESIILKQSNSSETLLSGSEADPVEADEEHDIFDHLMKTIQNHWLDFVGKMKLSVLDVWKSISQHMMERLESFASTL